MSDISFKDQVVIVTGAGGGLGRTYAMDIARRGGKVVVNDFGGTVEGLNGVLGILPPNTAKTSEAPVFASL